MQVRDGVIWTKAVVEEMEESRQIGVDSVRIYRLEEEPLGQGKELEFPFDCLTFKGLIRHPCGNRRAGR